MATLFGKQISQQSQPTLFSSTLPKNENEEQKSNMNSSLFNNDKPTLFGALFNQNTNNEKKDNQENNNKTGNLFGFNNTKGNLFQLSGKKEKEKKDESNDNKFNLFTGGPFKFDFNESSGKKEEKEKEKEKTETNNIFKSPENKKSINKNLFGDDNINTGLNFTNKENKTSNEKKEIFNEKQEIFNEKKENKIPIAKENINIFGKKEENENKKFENLIQIPTSKAKNQNTNQIDENKSPIFANISNENKNKNKSISTNQTSNKNSSYQRIEDNDQVQESLQKLYVTDILLPSPFNYRLSPFPKIKKNDKNKGYNNKKNKTIDFKFFIEIKDIPNVKDEGCNMICKFDESMSKLMKQAKLYIKKKYKMTKELNDFEIILMKNGYKLPISDNELIGEYIKNKDDIIIYLVHNSSQEKEEEKIYKYENVKIAENKENKKEEKYEPKNEISNDSDSDSDIIEEKEKLYSSHNININDINKIDKIEINKENQKNEDLLCPTDKLPILKREGYFMHPDEYTISRMTLNEIKNVTNFSIFNENGKIEFAEKVSLYGANLDKLFNIEHEFIEYEKGEWCHSPRGQNFNIPAVLTFYNVESNVDVTNDNEKEIFIENLKIKCEKYLNAKFISYDFDKGTLIYKIPYFY